MPRCPFAEWRPVPNFNKGGMRVLGFVPHVIVGSLTGAEGTFNNTNPHQLGGRRSAHFGVGKAGNLRQWVDTSDKAWAQAAGNSTYISVECEGTDKEPHTATQLETLARLLVWVHDVHGVPFKLANAPGERGVISHRNGGEAWGRHSCPGDLRHAQRPIIIARAIMLTAGSAPEPVKPAFPVVHLLEEEVRRIPVQVIPLGNGTGYWDLDGASGRPLVPFDKWTGAQPTVNAGEQFPSKDFPMVVQVKNANGNVRLWLGGFHPGDAPLVFVSASD